jgi:hypothetical protein
LIAVVFAGVAAVAVATSVVVVASALTSGKSPILEQVIPIELSSRLLPHKPLCIQQNCTHGAVRLSAPSVLQ